MRLGVHVGYWGLGMSSEEQFGIVKAAEDLDYDSVWTAEAYGSDAATVLAWLSARTERIALGSAIFQISARTPAMTAMTAATLDNLSDGRFRMGLGVSGPQVVEGWYGQEFAKPLKRTREYVAIMRKVLARERLSFDGEFFQIPRPGPFAKPLKLTITPIQQPLPIYLAAIGPKNTELTAEIADGWLPSFLAPDRMDLFQPHLAAGAERGGRDLGKLDVAPVVQAAIGDDLDRCRDFMRPFIALYVGGMGARDKNFYATLVGRYGFEEKAREIQDLYLSGKKVEAMAAIPSELIDMTCLVGPRDRVKDRLDAYRDAGINTVVVTPVAATTDGRIDVLRTLAELV